MQTLGDLPIVNLFSQEFLEDQLGWGEAKKQMQLTWISAVLKDLKDITDQYDLKKTTEALEEAIIVVSEEISVRNNSSSTSSDTKHLRASNVVRLPVRGAPDL